VTTADAGRRTPEAAWDISFLRVGALATAAGAVVAAPLAGLFAGWPGALGVLAGAAVVTAFFCVSGVVIAWAGRIDDALTLPAALGTFLVKAVLFFAALSAIPPDGWIDRLALAWSVVVGALLWSVVQARWVWTRQLYYVQPPAPPSTAPPKTAPPSSAQVRPDPERPTTRG
jgi:ATP synthase protein I